MANQITFTIETDAPYSKKEKENLLDAFLEFILNEDGDVDTDSVEISIVDVDSVADADNQKKREIVEDFLNNEARIEYQVQARIVDGNGKQLIVGSHSAFLD